MATAGPQQQAGILSFYDAPEKGPRLDAKVILVVVAVFVVIVIILDHFSDFLIL